MSVRGEARMVVIYDMSAAVRQMNPFQLVHSCAFRTIIILSFSSESSRLLWCKNFHVHYVLRDFPLMSAA